MNGDLSETELVSDTLAFFTPFLHHLPHPVSPCLPPLWGGLFNKENLTKRKTLPSLMSVHSNCHTRAFIFLCSFLESFLPWLCNASWKFFDAGGLCLTALPGVTCVGEWSRELAHSPELCAGGQEGSHCRHTLKAPFSQV